MRRILQLLPAHHTRKTSLGNSVQKMKASKQVCISECNKQHIYASRQNSVDVNSLQYLVILQMVLSTCISHILSRLDYYTCNHTNSACSLHSQKSSHWISRFWKSPAGIKWLLELSWLISWLLTICPDQSIGKNSDILSAYFHLNKANFKALLWNTHSPNAPCNLASLTDLGIYLLQGQSHNRYNNATVSFK
jgi:hypothetical protein